MNDIDDTKCNQCGKPTPSLVDRYRDDDNNVLCDSCFEEYEGDGED